MEYDKQYQTSLDKPKDAGAGERKAMKWFGIILAAIGFVFILERFVSVFEILRWWPFLLIVIGGILIWKAKQ
ncbi:MAG: hypothetical protein ACOYUZ_01510 [Patescibacteria group bacterium]